MKHVLRKSSFGVANATYQSGDYTNILRASDMAVEVIGNRVILSLDLSPSQPRGSKDSHSYTDAEDLKEDFETVDFVQLHRESWLEDGLWKAVKEADRPPALELQISFKDGTVRSMPASLDASDPLNFWIRRKA